MVVLQFTMEVPERSVKCVGCQWMKCSECEIIHIPKIIDLILEGKIAFSFLKWKFHNGICEVYLDWSQVLCLNNFEDILLVDGDGQRTTW